MTTPAITSCKLPPGRSLSSCSGGGMSCPNPCDGARADAGRRPSRLPALRQGSPCRRPRRPLPELPAGQRLGRRGERELFLRPRGTPAGCWRRSAATLGSIPRVLLPDTEEGHDGSPLVQPSSSEIPAARRPPARVQLLGEIARGGMGAILKGRDPDLGRDLAVKVLLEEHRDRPELVRRFVEEAQIAGQLQHPGVVPVYELGCFADGRPYFTMKLVKGRTLAQLLADRASPGPSESRFLGIFEQVAQTIAYAHARGVIHRDLKPSNVMVGSFGEVQVMDWGLAKVLPRGGAVDDATAGKLADRRDGHRHGPQRGDADADLSQCRLGDGHAQLHGARAGPRRGRPRWTNGPTSSRWARSSARSSPGLPRSSAGLPARSSGRPPGATWPTPSPGSPAAGSTASWWTSPATAWPPSPTIGPETPAW